MRRIYRCYISDITTIINGNNNNNCIEINIEEAYVWRVFDSQKTDNNEVLITSATISSIIKNFNSTRKDNILFLLE